MLKAALIGFGGIAKAHRKGYANLKKQGIVQLVCACDIDPKAFSRKVTINIDEGTTELEESIAFYTDLDQMLAEQEFDFADICAPTYVHAELAQKLLRRGYHVLSEKPMALHFSDCEAMMQAAEESGKELMIGQCLRFDPGYGYLKAAVEDGRFGAVQGAFFNRISPPPVWGYQNWFMNPELSGGCLTDMHIHDVDMARYLFGEPQAVSCCASTTVCLHDAVHTSFRYDSFPVTAVGDWTQDGIRFVAGFRVNFEKATLVQEKGVLTVYPKDGSEKQEISLPKVSGYEGEIAYFCDVITGKTANLKNPASSAANTIRLIECMRESADNGGKIVPFTP